MGKQTTQVNAVVPLSLREIIKPEKLQRFPTGEVA